MIGLEMAGRKSEAQSGSVEGDISAELLAAVREIVRRAVMTLAAVRDPDRRYLGYASLPQHVVHDVQEAYGYSSTAVRSFIPTAYEIDQMEVVLPWLAWVRREEGDVACRRIIAWAMGAALWRLGQREGCSDRTIFNRIDRSIAAMIRKFTGADIPVEHIDEPYRGASYALVFERPSEVREGAEVRFAKVYVGGIGFVKKGRRIRTALDSAKLQRVGA